MPDPARPRRTGRDAVRTALVGLVVGVNTLLAAALVLREGADEGRVLWTISATHGIHVRDLVVIAVWALATVASVALLRRRA